MNTEKWNPGHSVNKGYPFDFPISQLTFKDRPRVWEKEDGKIAIDWDKDKFPPVGPEMQDLIDFCLFRLIDFQEALLNAEGQIMDMLAEKPFIPEDHGFKVAIQHTKVTDAPLRIYENKFNPDISLFRKPGDPGDENWNPSVWTLMRKLTVGATEQTKFQQDDLILPCARIAYATLFALGVQMTDPSLEETLATGESVMPSAISDETVKLIGKKTEKIPFKKFTVKFERNLPNHSAIIRTIPDIPAMDESEAFSKAMFHLQTEDGIDDIKKEEMVILTPEEIQSAIKEANTTQ
jgi:hypothetical protein